MTCVCVCVLQQTRSKLHVQSTMIISSRPSPLLLPPQAGYTPMMLAAAYGVEVGEHKEIMSHLVSRGNVNAVAHQVCVCVCMCDTVCALNC